MSACAETVPFAGNADAIDSTVGVVVEDEEVEPEVEEVEEVEPEVEDVEPEVEDVEPEVEGVDVAAGVEAPEAEVVELPESGALTEPPPQAARINADDATLRIAIFFMSLTSFEFEFMGLPGRVSIARSPERRPRGLSGLLNLPLTRTSRSDS